MLGLGYFSGAQTEKGGFLKGPYLGPLTGWSDP